MTKQNLKRIISLLMVAVLCLSLTACSNSSDDDSEWSVWEEVSYVNGTDEDDSDKTGSKDTTAENDNDTASKTDGDKTSSKTDGGKTSSKTDGGKTSSETDTDKPSTETVDKKDLKGYTFTLMSPYLPAKLTSSCTGFEKVLFQRIAEVEKEYGCKIKLLVGTETGVENLQPLISAGKKVADVVEVIADNVLPLASANYIIPWDNVKGIDVKSDKWVEGYTKLATIDNKHYGLQFMKPPEARMVVVFNKDLLKEKGIDADSLYKLAKDKKWTFAKMQEYAKKATTVVNGTTTTYGVGGVPLRIAMALTLGNNGRLVTYSGGKAKATFSDTATVNAINYFNTLVNVDKVFEIPAELKTQSLYGKLSFTFWDDAFLKGKTAFLIQESYVVNQDIKPAADFDYGILPVPMGPDNKTGNYISSAGNARVFAMTSTNANNKDYEKSIAIFNALSTPSKGYEGNDWWEFDVKSEYFQKDSADTDFEMYMTSINTSEVDPGWRLLTLKESFLSKGVLGPIFWKNGQTVQAGINSIAGTFDKTIDSVFNKK